MQNYESERLSGIKSGIEIKLKEQLQVNKCLVPKQKSLEKFNADQQ